MKTPVSFRPPTTPATVALNRGNISDSLMILLLVLAADAVSAAIAAGDKGARYAQARLILAAFWVGLAFQAKMIEAWLVLPAFGLVYLVSAPGPVRRRLRQLAVAGAVAGLVSLSWMTAVSLVPASHRPYVDGSRSDSVYQQVFVYNGFGRFGEQTPLQLLAGQSLGLGSVVSTPPPAPGRLLRSPDPDEPPPDSDSAVLSGSWAALSPGELGPGSEVARYGTMRWVLMLSLAAVVVVIGLIWMSSRHG